MVTTQEKFSGGLFLVTFFSYDSFIKTYIDVEFHADSESVCAVSVRQLCSQKNPTLAFQDYPTLPSVTKIVSGRLFGLCFKKMFPGKTMVAQEGGIEF